MKNKNSKFIEAKRAMDQFLIHIYNSFNQSKHTKICLLLFFSLIELLIVKEHIIWRDDARPILIATLNNSFADFYTEMRYESTPMLYHFFLWSIKSIIPLTVLNVKLVFFIVNFSILVTLIYLIKIPNVYKLLILLQTPILGYLNYVRQYSWAILFILLFTHVYNEKKDKSLWIYILLFLMCQVVIHSCIAAIGLYVFILINRLNDKEKLFKAPDLILLLGFLLCCIQITQPPDIMHGLKSLKPFFTPLTLNFTYYFINQIFLTNLLSSYGLCVMIWYSSKKLVKENNILNIAFYVTVCSIGTIFYLIGTLRYYSLDRHLWILSFVVIGLLIILNKDLPYSIKKISGLNYLLFLLLFSNIISYIPLVQGNLQLESTSNKIAAYLDEYYPDKLTLNEHDFLTDAINIHRKEIRYYYSLDTHRFLKYVRWNNSNVDFFKYFKEGTILLKVSSLIKDLEECPETILRNEPIIVISADRFKNDTKFTYKNIQVKRKYKLDYLTQFAGGGLENFVVYKITKL
jgi:hypothetical protein